jgi:hypothetical protein
LRQYPATDTNTWLHYTKVQLFQFGCVGLTVIVRRSFTGDTMTRNALCSVFVVFELLLASAVTADALPRGGGGGGAATATIIVALIGAAGAVIAALISRRQ